MQPIKSPPDSEEAWGQFEQALAAVLGDMAEDEYLVISRKGTDYFVQFAAQGSFGMRAEAVSNTYIRRPSPLSEEACQRLNDLGWKSPTYAPPDVVDEPADGSPNFYLDAAVPVPYNVLAHLAVMSLRTVYGVRHPGELQYGGFTADGYPLVVPSLMIKRETR